MQQASKPEAAEASASLGDLDTFIERAMADWRCPGMALAVAQDGAIVYQRGFGQRDRERDLPVTEQTLFAIGSCTKAFTTASLALLVDEGKLDWDAPARTYLPDFALRDRFASERISPRDLVTHRSGLPRHDALWYGSPLSRDELVARLRHLQPNADFRTRWQYQNLMYLTAGYLAGRVAGMEWEAFVQQRLLDPLGMANANFSVDRSQAADDAALPYQDLHGTVRRMAFRNLDAIAPAGSMNASIADMAAWLLLHLNRGKHDDERIISETQIAEMHAPQMVMPDDRRFAEVTLPTYALGWFVESYKGRAVVSHGGNIDGFSALVSLMPREGIGVVALTNLNGIPLPEIVASSVYDRLLGLPATPWNDRFLKLRDEVEAAGEQSKSKGEADRVANTSPSHRLADYAGEYADPGYGALTIGHDGDALSLRYNAFAGPLQHRHYDTFEFLWEQEDERFPCTFATDAAGRVASVAIPFEPAVADIVFVRQPPAAMTEPAFLDRFVGAYELMGVTLTVARKGAALWLSIPGQPDYELEPAHGTAFRLKGRGPEFGIEFQTDERGDVAAALVTQPNAVFTARKIG
ncbi:MAG TPA: serine hydrolase [Thermomicrobiales bacterium]|nr:serine hydrolase [Thermomicrobiales bacterium]